MADFPTSVFVARETENLPGLVYDAADKRTMFSEDFQNLGSEITAIETYLLTPMRYKINFGISEPGSVGIIQFENSVGAIEWEYIGSGIYHLNLTGAFADMNIFYSSAIRYSAENDSQYYVQVDWVSDDYLQLTTYDLANESVDVNFTGCPLLIELYPA